MSIFRTKKNKPSKIKMLMGIMVLGMVLFGFLFVVAGYFVLGAISYTSNEPEPETGGGEWNVSITELGENEIPAEFIPIYQEAADKYNIPWNLLAGVHRVETVFSTLDDMVSYAGAEGHFQFMPCTWAGWAHPSCSGLGAGNIPSEDLTDPDKIAEWGGYGVDANGDGKADPWDIEDAVHTAANYLAASGAASGDIDGAIFNYNHSTKYVADVKSFMNQYGQNDFTAVDLTLPGAGRGSDAIEGAIDIGMSIVGQSPYNFGGGRNELDIARRSFDCSSFIRWAFDEGGGVQIDQITTVTTDTLYAGGQNIDESQKQRGDLIFFDTYKQNGHIAIYLGNGDFLHSGSSNGVAVNNLDESYWSGVYNNNVVRFVD